jgi:protein KRI1
VAARLEAKATAYGSEEESSSEEEDDGYIPDKTEAQIFETLMKIRRKDKSIYDKEAKFYSSDDGEGEDGEEGGRKKKTKKEKPMYLKDVVYKEAMDRAAGLGTDSDEDEENGGGRDGGRKSDNVKTYKEEQQDLKNSFLQAFETEVDAQGDDDFGGVLKARRKAARAAAAAAAAGEDVGNVGEGREEARVQELLDAYFTSEGKKEMGEDDKFLRSFILKKGWVDQGDDDSDDNDGGDKIGGGDVDDEEDEAAFEAAQAFEAHYNFRYEEPGSGQLVTHPRQIEGTVRKEDDRRKKSRAEKAARKLAEEEERRAEVKRLKNLKKAEIEGRLHELQYVAGAAAPKEELLDELLAGDFDPEAHDRAMSAAFNDDYYGEGDEEDEEDIQHDELFAKELEAMAKYDDTNDNEDDNTLSTFAALQRRLKQEEEEEERQNGMSAGATAARSDIKQLLEEYHKLDYEDHVGGIPTRFRYKEVQPETYGLSIEEILMMDDKELNQVVGLKKIAAPYREEYKKVRPNYGALNEWRKEKEEERYEKQNKKFKRRESSEKKKRSKGGGDDDDDDKEMRESGRHVKLTAEERRLASFQVPTLKKKRDRETEGDTQIYSTREKMKKSHGNQHHRQQQQGVEGTPSGLSKAQKKNMKRAAKRAAKAGTAIGVGKDV